MYKYLDIVIQIGIKKKSQRKTPSEKQIVTQRFKTHAKTEDNIGDDKKVQCTK